MTSDVDEARCPACGVTSVSALGGGDAICERCGLLRVRSGALLSVLEQWQMMHDGYYWVRGLGWENGVLDEHTRTMSEAHRRYFGI